MDTTTKLPCNIHDLIELLDTKATTKYSQSVHHYPNCIDCGEGQAKASKCMLCHTMTCSRHHKKATNLKKGEVLCNKCEQTLEPPEEGLDARLQYLTTLIESYNTLYLKAQQLPSKLREDANEFRNIAKSKNISNITTASTGAAAGIATIVGAALLLTPAAPAGMTVLASSGGIGLLSAGARIGTEITVGILQKVDSFSKFELLEVLESTKIKLNKEIRHIMEALKEYEKGLNILYAWNHAAVRREEICDLGDLDVAQPSYEAVSAAVSGGLGLAMGADDAAFAYNSMRGAASLADEGVQSIAVASFRVGFESAFGIACGAASLGLNINDLVKEVNDHIKGNPAPIADFLYAHASSIEELQSPKKLLENYHNLKQHFKKLSRCKKILKIFHLVADETQPTSEMESKFYSQLKYTMIGTAVYVAACGLCGVDGNSQQVIGFAKYSMAAMLIFYALAATLNTCQKTMDDFNANIQNENARKNLFSMVGDLVGAIVTGVAKPFLLN